jgi:hypothetical protein
LEPVGCGHNGVFLSRLLAAIGKRHPSGRGRFLLYAGLLPVVKAWSPFSKKGDEEEKVHTRGSKYRIFDKSDKTLFADITKSDELYQTGNRTDYEEAYQILQKHLVRFFWKMLLELFPFQHNRSRNYKHTNKINSTK